MGNVKYICADGEFRRISEPFLDSQNRAFRYGDALYENIHAFATEAQFLEQHYNRLVRGMDLLFMRIPGWFTVNYLAQLISQLLTRNRIFGGAFIRLTLYRKSGGRIKPENSEISFVIESQSLLENQYVLNEKGLVIDLCQDYQVHVDLLSGIKITASLPYVLTGLYCERNQLDDAVMLNDTGKITGSYRSNIFLVRDSSLFTPGLDQGCIAGVMREVIIKLSVDTGLRINDQGRLTPAVLDVADEVFLTNAVEGIRWVGAYRKRRYYKKTSQLLVRILNEYAFGGYEKGLVK
jgi:branched-chain amino acid aminotransferase